jgi:hypothetical protein
MRHVVSACLPIMHWSCGQGAVVQYSIAVFAAGNATHVCACLCACWHPQRVEGEARAAGAATGPSRQHSTQSPLPSPRRSPPPCSAASPAAVAASGLRDQSETPASPTSPGTAGTAAGGATGGATASDAGGTTAEGSVLPIAPTGVRTGAAHAASEATAVAASAAAGPRARGLEYICSFGPEICKGPKEQMVPQPCSTPGCSGTQHLMCNSICTAGGQGVEQCASCFVQAVGGDGPQDFNDVGFGESQSLATKVTEMMEGCVTC